MSPPHPLRLSVLPATLQTNIQKTGGNSLSLLLANKMLKCPGTGAGRAGGPELSPHVPRPVQHAMGKELHDSAAPRNRTYLPCRVLLCGCGNRWANTLTRKPFLPHTKHTTWWTWTRPLSPSLTSLSALSSSPFPPRAPLLPPCCLRHLPFRPRLEPGRGRRPSQSYIHPELLPVPWFLSDDTEAWKAPTPPTH